MLGSDAGEHEDLRCGDGAGAHDDLPPGEDVVVLHQPDPVLALEPHPPRTPVQHDHTLHQRVLEMRFMPL